MSTRATLFARPHTPQTEDDGFDREELVLAALDVEMAWIDLELVVDGRAELACEDLAERRTWIYRGWMLSAEEHEELEQAVRERRGRLLVGNDAYTTASYLPEWAPLLGEHTPRSEWTFGDDLDEAWEAAQRLGPPPWILKDHVKSVSDDWEGACFVPAGADRGRFMRTARAMIEARGERFERGIVIRQYEAPRTLGYRLPERAVPDEHRVVFVRRRIVAHAPYFDVDARPLDEAELRHLETVGRRIPSPFFVLDVMRAACGRLRVIEVNDGGTSRLPDQLEAREVYEALFPER